MGRRPVGTSSSVEQVYKLIASLEVQPKRCSRVRFDPKKGSAGSFQETWIYAHSLKRRTCGFARSRIAVCARTDCPAPTPFKVKACKTFKDKASCQAPRCTWAAPTDPSKKGKCKTAPSRRLRRALMMAAAKAAIGNYKPQEKPQENPPGVETFVMNGEAGVLLPNEKGVTLWRRRASTC